MDNRTDDQKAADEEQMRAVLNPNDGPYELEDVFVALAYWIERHKRAVSEKHWHDCDIEMPFSVAEEVKSVLGDFL